MPFQEVELHAKVAGFIRHINVDIGDRVHAGQVLATLEVPELNAQVAGAEAGVRHGQEEIGLAKSEVARAEANHAALHMAAERLRQAAGARPGMIAQQELDDAAAKDRASEAQVAVAKSTVAAQEQQLDVAKAERMHYTSLADYSKITAPFDGVVTERLVHPGALVGPGADPVLLVIQHISRLRLIVPVPEEDISALVPGTSVSFRVPAYPNRIYSATIARNAHTLDAKTRSLPVELDVFNRDGSLSPGMYPSVKWPIRRAQPALFVPKTSVVTTTERTFVIRDRDGHAEWVDV